jgi:hypothetical protein
LFKWLLALVFLLAVGLPLQAFAADDLDALKDQVKVLQEKIEKLEKQSDWAQDDIDDLSSRVDATEMHTTTDKVSFGVEFRSRADSLHYDNIQMAPAQMVGAFFTPAAMGGFNGATLSEIQGAIGMMYMYGMVPPAESYDADNDIIYTNKFRLNMKAVVNSHLRFDGRLAAYKVFGDSTGVKFNQGSMGDVTFDGNSTSLPHGDTIRLERAYFVLSNEFGDVPVSFSFGRRPSTDGPPMEYGNYSLVGGSPLTSIINWQFDGASLAFGLERLTGLPGLSFKLCYGVGFEADWGNSTSLNYMQSDLKDVHLWGFISDLYDNGNTSLMLNYAHASDITDGFAGLTVMPFIVEKADQNMDGTPEYYFSQNSGGFITRFEPQTNIGDWDAATLLLRTNLEDLTGVDIDLFASGSWTSTDPTAVSMSPFYEIMGMGLLSSNGNLEAHDGYGVYAGAVFPMPKEGRLGVEYNHGSKYWFPFTGAEDSLIGSKVAVRGDVYEAYYIKPFFDGNFFVKLGAQLYDYAYTGSGSPLGAPVKISEATALDAINPIIDEVSNYYLSGTFRF